MSEELELLGAMEVQLRTIMSRLGNIMDRTDALEVRAKDVAVHLNDMEGRLLESGNSYNDQINAVLEVLELIKSDTKDAAEKSEKLTGNVGNALAQRIDALADKVKNININL